MAKRLEKESPDPYELHCTAMEFTEKATILSRAIEEADIFLSSLPGKLEVSVACEKNSQCALTFRKGSNGWSLYLGQRNAGHGLDYTVATSCTVEQKILVAMTLPSLYQLLSEKLELRRTQLDDGLQALSNLPFLDVKKITRDEQEKEAKNAF